MFPVCTVIEKGICPVNQFSWILLVEWCRVLSINDCMIHTFLCKDRYSKDTVPQNSHFLGVGIVRAMPNLQIPVDPLAQRGRRHHNFLAQRSTNWTVDSYKQCWLMVKQRPVEDSQFWNSWLVHHTMENKLRRQNLLIIYNRMSRWFETQVYHTLLLQLDPFPKVLLDHVKPLSNAKTCNKH